MICTLAEWIAKEGRVEEFERRWQELADALAPDYPNLTFRLLRDRANPRRFIGLTEGWRNTEQVAAVQSLPGYQDSVAALWRVVDGGETATLELAVEIS
jgi:quinol monooxygenase YgiN